MKRVMSLFLLAALCAFGWAAAEKADYRGLIAKGEFAKAAEVIRSLLANDKTLTDRERLDLRFELERMDRIRLDFRKTRPEVVEFIKKYIPGVTDQDLDRWEKDLSLEGRTIDGQKLYFNNAARNLFRIDKECLRIWNEKHADELAKPPAPGALDLDAHIREVREAAAAEKRPFVKPIRVKIHYTISVKPDVIPAGEVVRCWIPFPREIDRRQYDIRLIGTEPAAHKLAPNEDLQRMIYFEKTAAKGRPTEFAADYEYTSAGVYVDIDPAKARPVDPNTAALKPYLAEEKPHIEFTKALRDLSKEVVGAETNPYRVAQRLFEWVDINVPWASAREYSTVFNIPMYAFRNRHGDCGMQTLLFMTLCRMNGIPTRWQSGWEFQPPEDSMHDWGLIYFEPYGWVPMDVTYGRRKSDDEKQKWFYLSGMDSYRLIFNDAITQPFTPAKEHFRSETVDSQRGEVEWKGGNLYFDKWDWDMKWEVVKK